FGLDEEKLARSRRELNRELSKSAIWILGQIHVPVHRKQDGLDAELRTENESALKVARRHYKTTLIPRPALNNASPIYRIHRPRVIARSELIGIAHTVHSTEECDFSIFSSRSQTWLLSGYYPLQTEVVGLSNESIRVVERGLSGQTLRTA